MAALGPLNSIAQHPLFTFHIRSRIYFQEIWGTFPDLKAHLLCAFCITTVEIPLTTKPVTSSHCPDLPQTLSTSALLPTADHISHPTSKQRTHTLQDGTGSPVQRNPTYNTPQHNTIMNEPPSQPLPPPKSLGTVLVVGGCGFLGYNVVDQLLNFPSERSDPPAPFSLGTNTGRYQFDYEPLSKRYPSFDQQGTKVHVLDLKCVRNRLPGATYHEADITKPTQLLEVFKVVQPDVVINTASPDMWAAKELLRKVNVDGSKILLDVAGQVKYGVWGKGGKRCKSFVHVSSSSVVSDASSDLKNADERWPLVVPNYREYYSETKAQGEVLVLQDNGEEDIGGLLTAAVRPAGIIGEGDQGGWVNAACKQASISPGWQLNVQLGDGNNLFDATYVGNVALGVLLVAEGLLSTATRIASNNNPSGGILEHERIDGEAFNVTNDQPCYFWEVSRFMYSRYGRDEVGGTEKIWSINEDMGWVVGVLSEFFGMISGRKGRLNRQTVKYSCMNRYFSCEKIKRRCGYRPVVGLEEGLARSVRWYKMNEDASVGGGEKKVQ